MKPPPPPKKKKKPKNGSFDMFFWFFGLGGKKNLKIIVFLLFFFFWGGGRFQVKFCLFVFCTCVFLLNAIGLYITQNGFKERGKESTEKVMNSRALNKRQ